ncbi:MCE family protein [Mycobacterium sp. CVI_P3]|uniref:MCE family protein n=1 Tax=Mycobacterium pinniadriaticum TaxID=2994102 RepID=A0ABT3SFH8_9MYCO|nr:MCE family protein [Mycobacterium pinniadriaticum]MCX2931783.1 MCE family protein [Mycobacterium pinniadriaticum]MCX2938142.1 MCE family protein [Mycobacterium pinniadriaticum]
MSPRIARIALAIPLVALLIAGIVAVTRSSGDPQRIHVTAYFANTNGMYVGDEVRVLGVAVGKIVRIEAQPERAKVEFWYDSSVPVPANANAVILSPSLVTARAVQLTPVYTEGPRMSEGAVIPQERTAVPVEWDDFRQQLEKLTNTLQPTEPGGASTLGQFISTTADNLRGQGTNIRETLVKLSQAFSALGDHSSDLFSTVKNLSTLVSALQGSADLMRALNQNLADVTGLLSNDTDEVGNAIAEINGVVGDVQSFVLEHKETLGTTSDKLASITTALTASLDDVKQTLHIAPNAFQNFLNSYQPAQASPTGAVAFNNFANPISFVCGAIQAASRMGAEQSAKLCAQYLAPIIKNRQFNFPPLGENVIVGTSARPNEVTYSEDWMRPDYIPPPAVNGADLAAEARSTNPADGLPGLMVAGEGRS